MNWDAIGAVGEIVGALAVVVSIIYLAIQIKQNSQLLRSAAQDSASQKYAITMGLPGQSPENAAIFNRGCIDVKPLTPEETTHFYMMIGNTFVQMDYTHQLYLDGNLSHDRWTMLWQAISYYFSLPGVRYWWVNFGKTVLIGSSSTFAKLLDKEFEKHNDQE